MFLFILPYNSFRSFQNFLRATNSAGLIYFHHSLCSLQAPEVQCQTLRILARFTLPDIFPGTPGLILRSCALGVLLQPPLFSFHTFQSVQCCSTEETRILIPFTSSNFLTEVRRTTWIPFLDSSYFCMLFASSLVMVRLF